MSLIQPDAQQWSEMLASFIRNWVLCKDCPPVKKPHMLEDAPQTCSHLSTSNSQARFSNPMLPSPLDSLKLAYSSCKNDPWTSCPHLDPWSHLPSNPTTFCLWFRLPRLNTQSVCLSAFQFQLGFSCLPLCNLLVYLLLVPISVISFAQTTWSSIPDNAYSTTFGLFSFSFYYSLAISPVHLTLCYTLLFTYTCCWHTRLSIIGYLCLFCFPTWFWFRDFFMGLQYQASPHQLYTSHLVPAASFWHSSQITSVLLSVLFTWSFCPTYPTPSLCPSRLPCCQHSKDKNLPL